MKVRDVVVWFVEPVKVDGVKRAGRIKLAFEVRVDGGPASAAAEQLLRSAPHPEDKLEGPMAEVMQGLAPALAHLQAQLQEPPTPGVRRLHDWVEFTTAAGEILLVPQERIAWIELGAETERA